MIVGTMHVLAGTHKKKTFSVRVVDNPWNQMGHFLNVTAKC
jgi:hypothetical protein